MKKIVVTIGDVAGCGPYISLRAIKELEREDMEFFLVGDRKVLQQIDLFGEIEQRVHLIDLNTPSIEKVEGGYPSLLSGKASLSYLNKALQVMEREKIRALVTAPISKEAVAMVQPDFCGHTEYLANYFSRGDVAMMMVSSQLKVVPVTRHIPLREVGVKLRKEIFLKTFNLIFSFLQDKFGIKEPRIGVASINPHAGVDTFLEREEELIKQAIEEFGKTVEGPYPADTLFIRENMEKYHCIICGYHDQAMIPFKLLSFQEGVNLTVGLPIIRTSPVHGVAYELVKRKKVPFHSSMVAAIRLAAKLA